MFASIGIDRKVKGFMLEAKRRDKGAEKRCLVSGRDELEITSAIREARFRTQSSKAGHSYSSEANFFSYGSATMPIRGHCWGILITIALLEDFKETKFLLVPQFEGQWQVKTTLISPL